MSDEPAGDDREATEADIEPDRSIRHLLPLPDDAIPMSVVEVVDYIDGDGDHAYGFRVDGTESTAAVLGLLELAKMQVIQQSDFGDN